MSSCLPLRVWKLETVWPNWRSLAWETLYFLNFFFAVADHCGWCERRWESDSSDPEMSSVCSSL